MPIVAIVIASILGILGILFFVKYVDQNSEIAYRRLTESGLEGERLRYHRDAKLIAEILICDYAEIRHLRDQLKHMPYSRDGPNRERNVLLRKLRRCVGPKYRSFQSHMRRMHDVEFYRLVLDYIRKSN